MMTSQAESYLTTPGQFYPFNCIRVTSYYMILHHIILHHIISYYIISYHLLSPLITTVRLAHATLAVLQREASEAVF
jgi:hypothetical protein